MTPSFREQLSGEFDPIHGRIANSDAPARVQSIRRICGQPRHKIAHAPPLPSTPHKQVGRQRQSGASTFTGARSVKEGE